MSLCKGFNNLTDIRENQVHYSQVSCYTFLSLKCLKISSSTPYSFFVFLNHKPGVFFYITAK